MCFLMKEDKTATTIAEGSNPGLVKPLDPAANIQKMQRTENHKCKPSETQKCRSQLHHAYTISKIQTEKIFTSSIPGPSLNKHKEKKREAGESYSLKEAYKKHKL